MRLFLNVLYATVQSLIKFYVIILLHFFSAGVKRPKYPASYGLRETTTLYRRRRDDVDYAISRPRATSLSDGIIYCHTLN